MKRVNGHEFKIIKPGDGGVYTTGLFDEVAFAFLVPDAQEAGLARNLNQEEIKTLLDKLTTSAKKTESKKLELRAVGGDLTEESLQYVAMLNKTITEFNDGDCSIDVEMKVNGDLHPNFLSITL